MPPMPTGTASSARCTPTTTLWWWGVGARPSRLLRLEDVELLQERLGVVRRVVLDDLDRVAAVDRVDVRLQLAVVVGLQLLDLLQAAALHERLARRRVVRQHLGELLHDVLDDLGRRLVQQGLQGGRVRALLHDRLDGALRLGLEVGGPLVRLAARVDVRLDDAAEHVGLGQRLGVLGRVPPDLPQRPAGGRLDVRLGLVDQRVLQRQDALVDDDGQRQRLREGADVPEGHDARQPRVALRLGDVVDDGGVAAGIDDQLGQLGRVLGDLADQRRRVLPDDQVEVLEADEHLGEHLGLDDDLGEVHAVLRDLRQRQADLPLQLAVLVLDHGRQELHGAAVDDGLGQLRRVLADLGQRRRGDALQAQLGLLQAQDELWNGAGVDDDLGQVRVVPGDEVQRPGGALLDAGLELGQAADQGDQGAGVDDRLRQLGRVLRHRFQHERRRLLVVPVLLGQRVDELRQDLVHDDGLGERLAVVGQAAQGDRRRLLDGRHRVEQQRAQQGHDARVLQRLDVGGAHGVLGDRLDERRPGRLVLLEHLQDRTRRHR